MKERPIIFSGEMVRTILDGSKSMTRRVLRPQPDNFRYLLDGQGELIPLHGDKEITCPYGVPGDRLWVRETWAALWPDEDPAPLEECTIEYKADTPNAPYPGNWPEDEARGNPEAAKWISPIFMPRRVSRILLEVTGVRFEPLHRIGKYPLDVVREGIGDPYKAPEQLVPWFIQEWNRINRKRGFGWEKNPWVWVVSFRQLNLTAESTHQEVKNEFAR